MSDYHQKRAAEILKQIQYATLATVTPEGLPWNSPVAHTLGEDLNIYWFSDKEGQHSKNVRANGEVFIVIYDSTVPEGDGEGVYIQAKAFELDDPTEILRVRKLKKGEDYVGKPNDFTGDAIRRVYKAVPQRVWMNDDVTEDKVFIKDIRVEVDLKRLKNEQGITNSYCQPPCPRCF